MKVSEDFLRRGEKIEHLPESKFEIHLLKVTHLTNELVPFASCG